MQVALIGYGYWGRNVAKAIIDSGFFSLKCIFDLDKTQIEESKKLYNFKEYSSYEAILLDEEIEAIFIVTPPQSHFDLALKALKSNKHIFVEKPLCMDDAKALILYQEAKRRKLSLHCDHIFLYAPPIQWLKQNLSILGNIVYINSRRINLGLFQNSVDVIWDLAIHDLSIIDYLIGLEIKNIEVFKRTYQNYPNDAIANINLELQNGIIVTINVSWLSPIKVREMIIGGENKTAIYDETKSQKLAIFDSGVVIRDEFDSQSLYKKMVEYKIGSTSYPKLDSKPALNQSIEAFIFKIKNPMHTQHLIDEKHTMHIIKILKQISASEI
ncbi:MULTISPECIES: Gfo/Idh/MocA family protein [unclassified Helicobacter]|uniref:Gfo/Idh/MocA family protein n=1 Tax=unclassified Helicobacter TaxID=2593540 RepID=UPI001F1F9136|nr:MULTISPECIES: Gfo/Idh/MocA family oxidoreductase [unclassified Helicobacter]